MKNNLIFPTLVIAAYKTINSLDIMNDIKTEGIRTPLIAKLKGSIRLYHNFLSFMIFKEFVVFLTYLQS